MNGDEIRSGCTEVVENLSILMHTVDETDMIDFVIDQTVTINSLEGIQMGTVQYYHEMGIHCQVYHFKCQYGQNWKTVLI